MEYRVLGRTGLKVSEIGFGCGAIGGLMTKGDPGDQVRAVARAMELGINYFDTAPLYGAGQSEQNLGRVLDELKPDVVVGTKVQFQNDLSDIGGYVEQSVETSLRRLRREAVDIVHLHNSITAVQRPMGYPINRVDELLEAFGRLKQAGKIRACGLTAHGETRATHQAVATGGFDTAQVFYNLLNPTAGRPVTGPFYAQDFDHLLDAMAQQEMGALGVRVVAAGALSEEPPHPLAPPDIAPFGSGPDAATDRRLAQRFAGLTSETGSTLQDVAIRFVLADPRVSMALLGFSSIEQLEQACGTAKRGSLPAALLDRISQIQDSLAV